MTFLHIISLQHLKITLLCLSSLNLLMSHLIFHLSLFSCLITSQLCVISLISLLITHLILFTSLLSLPSLSRLFQLAQHSLIETWKFSHNGWIKVQFGVELVTRKSIRPQNLMVYRKYWDVHKGWTQILMKMKGWRDIWEIMKCQKSKVKM